MELEAQIDHMDERLEKVEIRLETIDSKADSTHYLVKEIHSIVLGTEYTRNDSVLTKVTQLQEKVKILEEDKAKRDTNIKTYLGIAGVIGAVLWAIIQAILKYVALLAK